MAYYQSISPDTIQLKHEFTMIVAGPTKSGKMVNGNRLMKTYNANIMFILFKIYLRMMKTLSLTPLVVTYLSLMT